MGKIKKVIAIALSTAICMSNGVLTKAESISPPTVENGDTTPPDSSPNTGTDGGASTPTTEPENKTTILDGMIGPYYPGEGPNFEGEDVIINGQLPTDYYTIKATVPTNMNFILYSTSSNRNSMLVSPNYSVTNQSKKPVTIKAQNFIMEKTIGGQNRPSDTVPLYVATPSKNNEKVEMDLQLDFSLAGSTKRFPLRTIVTERNSKTTPEVDKTLGIINPNETANIKFSADSDGWEIPIDEGIVKNVVSDYKLVLEFSVD